MNDVQQLRADFTAHTLADAAFHLEVLERLDKLATKEDVKDVTTAFNTITGNGKFIIWLGALAAGVIVIMGGWKAAVIYVFGK